MTRLACILALMLAVPQTPSKNFDVDSTFEKQRDFASFKTYAWAAGHDAFDRSVDKLIRNAIDSEMKALGFGPGVAGKADVTIRYHSGLSTEVDLKALGKMSKEEAAIKAPPTHKLGVLAVVMHDAKGQQVWAAKTKSYVDPAASPEDIAKRVVQRLFETYPTKKR